MMRGMQGECPRCSETLKEGPYPRHSIILQDESDEAANRRIERRLCPTCWNDEYDSLAQGQQETRPQTGHNSPSLNTR